MKELTVYAYPKCGTCRKALQWLREAGHIVHLVDIVERPPGSGELEKLIQASGLELKKFFNVSGEVYKEMQLKDKLQQMSDEAKIELLAANGKLIKRPIVTDGVNVTVGYREDEFDRIWKKLGIM